MVSLFFSIQEKAKNKTHRINTIPDFILCRILVLQKDVQDEKKVASEILQKNQSQHKATFSPFSVSLYLAFCFEIL